MADEFWKDPKKAAPIAELIAEATKPWEEDWYPLEDTAGELDVYRDLDAEGSRTRVLASDNARPEDKARAKLAAAAPEMARLLLEVQWTPTGYDHEPCCPICSMSMPRRPEDRDEARFPHGHAKDCTLLAVLKKAGVLGSRT